MDVVFTKESLSNHLRSDPTKNDDVSGDWKSKSHSYMLIVDLLLPIIGRSGIIHGQ